MKYFIFALIILHIKTDCSTKSDELCQQCILGICTKCYQSYYTPESQSCKVPETLIDNCQSYEYLAEIECTKCLPGFYLKSKICKKIPDEKCLLAKNESGECEVCKNGKVFDDFAKKCTDTSCITENCRDCKLDVIEECVRCDSGYRLDLISLRKGYKCTLTDDFCGFSNPISGSCDKCEDGYFMKGEKCEKSSKIIGFDEVIDVLVDNKDEVKNGTLLLFWNSLLIISYLI